MGSLLQSGRIFFAGGALLVNRLVWVVAMRWAVFTLRLLQESSIALAGRRDAQRLSLESVKPSVRHRILNLPVCVFLKVWHAFSA